MAKEFKKESKDMTLEEAKAYRASLHVPKPIVLTEAQKKEAFRIFWTKEKYKYGKSKDLERIIWLHLKAHKLDEPSKFESGIKSFGLKKIKN